MTFTDAIAELLFGEQSRLVAAFEEYDGGAPFRRDPWQRAGFGRGRVCLLEGGRVFERAGVNVSSVAGSAVPATISEARPELAGQPYRATGISMVLHPLNPHAPSFHANLRYLEAGEAWWFGGGMDLTPVYGFEEDAVHFHRVLRDWCARHPVADHPAWKAACDDYFTIPHRGEMRGVGGVFFDGLTGGDRGAYRDLLVDGLASILPAYLPVLDRRRGLPYGERERRWQQLRRGRYVEFNLVYDRGTLFGLQTGGNIEAILISMPPVAGWAYDVRPEPGTPEAEVARFLRPRDWAGSEVAV
ncbi:oxygen-dependent coproporphyrinogen oxidase [Actinophytocola xanthii]|uniref:coproporphyrinogen oxidase n=1 Tax=Actinophytocola xanthii TaxID=1912961 RepID=A0A1Q8CMD0_9PSEU|nr:oxygen-dependent coproporphyrinogen oxidase [Actinophytocola xanthii]OLF15510.1 coproporphyrinogen III oxidase [Actinophytocola xanthii]